MDNDIQAMRIVQLPANDAHLLREGLAGHVGQSLQPHWPREKQERLTDVLYTVGTQLQRDI